MSLYTGASDDTRWAFRADVEETRRVYRGLTRGLDCTCEDCKTVSPHLDVLVPYDVKRALRLFGIDWSKPVEFMSITDDGVWIYASLCYEVVGEYTNRTAPCRSWITDVYNRLRLGVSMPIRDEFRSSRWTGVEFDVSTADLARIGPSASRP